MYFNIIIVLQLQCHNVKHPLKNYLADLNLFSLNSFQFNHQQHQTFI